MMANPHWCKSHHVQSPPLFSCFAFGFVFLCAPGANCLGFRYRPQRVHSVLRCPAANMEKTTLCRSLLIRFNLPRKPVIAILGGYLFYLLLVGTASVHALDPNKHLTQYMHTSWRTQDGAVPAGMFSVAQTSDGFLWFTSVSQGMYRFDGVRFVPWTLSVDGRTIDHIVSVHSDHAGGLWAVGEHEVFHLKGGVVVSHFALEGQVRTGNISVDPDGSLWTLQAGFDLHAPLCHVTDQRVKCFGGV